MLITISYDIFFNLYSLYFLQPTSEILIEMDNLIFYEVAMEKRENDTYLVTENQNYYPIKDFIVIPAEMSKFLNIKTINNTNTLIQTKTEL